MPVVFNSTIYGQWHEHNQSAVGDGGGAVVSELYISYIHITLPYEYGQRHEHKQSAVGDGGGRRGGGYLSLKSFIS